MTVLRRDQRGLTLTEVAVVMILGTMIMAGLVGFYLSSQGLWLDGSTQAITQREASLVASAIRDSVRRSGRAEASASPDLQHMQLALFKSADAAQSPSPYYYFYWNEADSLIHAGPTVAGPGAGPIGSSRSTRFQFVASKDGVRMDLRLLTATGNRVDMGAFAVFKN
jgi:Tfp pilus assembly protein PilW